MFQQQVDWMAWNWKRRYMWTPHNFGHEQNLSKNWLKGPYHKINNNLEWSEQAFPPSFRFINVKKVQKIPTFYKHFQTLSSWILQPKWQRPPIPWLYRQEHRVRLPEHNRLSQKTLTLLRFSPDSHPWCCEAILIFPPYSHQMHQSHKGAKR